MGRLVNEVRVAGRAVDRRVGPRRLSFLIGRFAGMSFFFFFFLTAETNEATTRLM